jgi:hypothetical protein
LSFALKPENEAITAPDFDIVILHQPLCEMHRVAIVPANEFFEADITASFPHLIRSICRHVALNLNEFRRTRNLQVGNLGLARIKCAF